MPEIAKKGGSARPGAPGPGGSKPRNSKPGQPGDWPGQPGTQPGDEWGDDNPGNVHAVGVDDHVFFHRDGAGPHAGKVVAHGVHGCQVQDDAGARHKVRWGRVLGVKAKAVLPAKVVDKGVGGSILEHADGRRIFVAGELPIDDAQPKFRDVAGLEDLGRQPPRAPKLAELEEWARAGGKDLAKADHECEGPALCRLCAARAAAAGEPFVKALLPDLEALEVRVGRMRAGLGGAQLAKSFGAGSRRIPVLFRPLDDA